MASLSGGGCAVQADESGGGGAVQADLGSDRAKKQAMLSKRKEQQKQWQQRYRDQTKVLVAQAREFLPHVPASKRMTEMVLLEELAVIVRAVKARQSGQAPSGKGLVGQSSPPVGVQGAGLRVGGKGLAVAPAFPAAAGTTAASGAGNAELTDALVAALRHLQDPLFIVVKETPAGRGAGGRDLCVLSPIAGAAHAAGDANYERSAGGSGQTLYSILRELRVGDGLSKVVHPQDLKTLLGCCDAASLGWGKKCCLRLRKARAASKEGGGAAGEITCTFEICFMSSGAQRTVGIWIMGPRPRAGLGAAGGHSELMQVLQGSALQPPLVACNNQVLEDLRLWAVGGGALGKMGTSAGVGATTVGGGNMLMNAAHPQPLQQMSSSGHLQPSLLASRQHSIQQICPPSSMRGMALPHTAPLWSAPPFLLRGGGTDPSRSVLDVLTALPVSAAGGGELTSLVGGDSKTKDQKQMPVTAAVNQAPGDGRDVSDVAKLLAGMRAGLRSKESKVRRAGTGTDGEGGEEHCQSSLVSSKPASAALNGQGDGFNWGSWQVCEQDAVLKDQLARQEQAQTGSQTNLEEEVVGKGGEVMSNIRCSLRDFEIITVSPRLRRRLDRKWYQCVGQALNQLVHPEYGKALFCYLRGGDGGKPRNEACGAGPAQAEGAEPLFLDRQCGGAVAEGSGDRQGLAVLLIVEAEEEADGNAAGTDDGKGQRNKARPCKLRSGARLCFVEATITIINRYNDAAPEVMSRQVGGQAGGSGEARECVELQVVWHEKTLAAGSERGAAGDGAADASQNSTPDPPVDPTWARGVFQAKHDAGGSAGVAVTDDVPPDVLGCWGVFRFNRQRSSDDWFVPMRAALVCLLLSRTLEREGEGCVCACACMCVCVCVYVRVCVEYISRHNVMVDELCAMYVCMHACMYVCMHASMYVCMYVCMHACMYVCMYVCMYLKR